MYNEDSVNKRKLTSSPGISWDVSVHIAWSRRGLGGMPSILILSQLTVAILKNQYLRNKIWEYVLSVWCLGRGQDTVDTYIEGGGGGGSTTGYIPWCAIDV